MVRQCAVACCKKRNIKGLSLFGFPDDPVIAKQWIDFCGKNYIVSKNSRICNLHFKKNDMLGYGVRHHLKRDVVPSINVSLQTCLFLISKPLIFSFDSRDFWTT